jgi:acetyltransferase-like isoleucine patch superfamily enzyme
VRLTRTVIGDRAKIASHAIVLAGQHVRDGEAVGSFPEDRL